MRPIIFAPVSIRGAHSPFCAASAPGRRGLRHISSKLLTDGMPNTIARYTPDFAWLRLQFARRVRTAVPCRQRQARAWAMLVAWVKTAAAALVTMVISLKTTSLIAATSDRQEGERPGMRSGGGSAFAATAAASAIRLCVHVRRLLRVMSVQGDIISLPRVACISAV